MSSDLFSGLLLGWVLTFIILGSIIYTRGSYQRKKRWHAILSVASGLSLIGLSLASPAFRDPLSFGVLAVAVILASFSYYKLLTFCPNCGAPIPRLTYFKKMAVCPKCGGKL